MIDSQVLSVSSFISKKTGVTYYNSEIFIPLLGVLLPFMSDSPFQANSKGKVVLGLSQDRRGLRITDFHPTSAS
ncbi:hypothetical protein SAMN05216339_12215 [Nitrosomonas eutropha]|uniref:Uncharacterized protein n=1 Tax=Nitrosomonas eutropha TaxID=916 RepID=A0A1I7JE58_9PROT|nr:hypothetical protein [Nitrosomonas eutropha]SFU83461.1 hypothetical protein SAMN05216339_12215 [Nitrosomonas eutropha]